MSKWFFVACVTAIISIAFVGVWSTQSIDTLRVVCGAYTAILGLVALSSVDIEDPEEGTEE